MNINLPLTSNVTQSPTEQFSVIKITPNTLNLTDLIRRTNNIPNNTTVMNKIIWDTFVATDGMEATNEFTKAIKEVVDKTSQRLLTDRNNLPTTLVDVIWMRDQTHQTHHASHASQSKPDTVGAEHQNLDDLLADTFVCYKTSEWLVELMCIDSSSYRNQSKPPINNLAMYLTQNTKPIYGNCCLMLTRNTYSHHDKNIKLHNATIQTVWDTLYHKFIKKGLIVKTSSQSTYSSDHEALSLVSSMLYFRDPAVPVQGFETFAPVKLTILKHTLVIYLDAGDDYRNLPINRHASALVGNKLVYGDVLIKLVSDDYEDFTEKVLMELTLACSSTFDIYPTESDETIDKHHIVASRMSCLDSKISYCSYLSNYKYGVGMDSLNAFARNNKNKK